MGGSGRTPVCLHKGFARLRRRRREVLQLDSPPQSGHLTNLRWKQYVRFKSSANAAKPAWAIFLGVALTW